MTKRLLVAFDFDHTVVDDNTDIVVRNLLPEDKITEEVKQLYRSDGWTTYMQKIFLLLHENGIKAAEIEDAVKKIPVTPGVDELLRFLDRPDCEVIIISDSNSIFIQEWLESSNLKNTVHKIFTNPAYYHDDGSLRIEMYHLQDWCKMSTKNLCKGHILEEYVKEKSKEGVTFSHVAYIGDGKNDMCPLLKLSHSDFAFPRYGFALAEVLARGDLDVKANIYPWRHGQEVIEHLSKHLS